MTAHFLQRYQQDLVFLIMHNAFFKDCFIFRFNSIYPQLCDNFCSLLWNISPSDGFLDNRTATNLIFDSSGCSARLFDGKINNFILLVAEVGRLAFLLVETKQWKHIKVFIRPIYTECINDICFRVRKPKTSSVRLDSSNIMQIGQFLIQNRMFLQFS